MIKNVDSAYSEKVAIVFSTGYQNIGNLITSDSRKGRTMAEHRITIRLTDDEEDFCNYAAEREGFGSQMTYIRAILEDSVYSEMTSAIKEGTWQTKKKSGKTEMT